MGKSAKKSATKVEVAPAAVATKPLKKGKREAEEAAEQVPAKKQKQNEAALKQAIAKKKAETKTKKSKKVETSSDDDSSEFEEKVEETTVVPAKIAKSAPKVKADSSSSDEDSDSEDDGNVISTPAIEGTILPGITRKSIIDVARSLGFQVEEHRVTVDELLDADEAFVTGTFVVLSPIGSITYSGKRVFDDP